MEIVWKILTAGHLVFLRPCPAAGHLVIAFSKSSVFTLFSVPRILKFKSSFIQRNENRALGKFHNPLVLKYDICPIIQEHRSVDFFPIFRNVSKLIRSCNRYGLQIARKGNITGVLVNSCIMKQSCKVSYIELQLPQIFITQPLASLIPFTRNCK